MNQKVTACLHDLEVGLRRIPPGTTYGAPLLATAQALRAAVQFSEHIYEHALAQKGPRTERDPLEMRSSGLRSVLERAWAADPRQTELDLIAGGRQDLAAALGNWWLGECYRRSQAHGWGVGSAAGTLGA